MLPLTKCFQFITSPFFWNFSLFSSSVFCLTKLLRSIDTLHKVNFNAKNGKALVWSVGLIFLTQFNLFSLPVTHNYASGITAIESFDSNCIINFTVNSIYTFAESKAFRIEISQR